MNGMYLSGHMFKNFGRRGLRCLNFFKLLNSSGLQTGWYVATLVPTNILFPQKSQTPSLLNLVVDEMVGMPVPRLNLNET